MIDVALSIKAITGEIIDHRGHGKKQSHLGPD
jgi:hypothetical protein